MRRRGYLVRPTACNNFFLMKSEFFFRNLPNQHLVPSELLSASRLGLQQQVHLPCVPAQVQQVHSQVCAGRPRLPVLRLELRSPVRAPGGDAAQLEAPKDGVVAGEVPLAAEAGGETRASRAVVVEVKLVQVATLQMNHSFLVIPGARHSAYTIPLMAPFGGVGGHVSFIF